MFKKVDEQTLCAWCDKPVGEHQCNLNGEYICLECYELHRRVRSTASKFWKGVKENVRIGK